MAAVTRVVIMVQENHTTDNYFRGLAPWGANVLTDWPLQPNPPAKDQNHSRAAYFKWWSGAGTATHTQFATAAVIPYYLWLAINGAFFENHCSGYGTNSTPNHLLILGGQSPTLRNPPSTTPSPVWDLPSLPGLAGEHQVGWRAYAGRSKYPFTFYQELAGSTHIAPSAQFVADAKSGTLPALCFMYHDSPLDEHPPADVTQGEHVIWQAVDAVVAAGQWDQTVFLLTWDDWGGWDDHVHPPVLEYTPDNVPLAYGPRVPLLMFGGCVRRGIDSRWCSHVSIPKTALQLLGLPTLGVPRLDDDGGLADRVAASPLMPTPPAYGTTVTLPSPPSPTPPVAPLPPSPGQPMPVGPVVLRSGGTLPPPNDQPLPQQPQPPTHG
jgi:hypothetical protein